ncbi:hypothetical protein D3C85_1611880 [compost metagenome]
MLLPSNNGEKLTRLSWSMFRLFRRPLASTGMACGSHLDISLSPFGKAGKPLGPPA